MVNKITYITNSSLPSYSADSVGIMNLCAAFASTGVDTRLAAARTPWIRVKNSKDLYKYYGVEKNFKISRFLVAPRRTGITFNFYKKALKIYNRREGVLFTRNLISDFEEIKDIKIIYELHHPPIKPTAEKMLFSEKVIRIICISKRLADWALQTYGSEIAEKTIVVPDAVNMKLFENQNYLAGPKDKFRAVYAGSLYEGKGIEIIIGLAEKFKEVKFIVAGGRMKEINYWKKQIKSENIEFIGYVAPSQIPELLKQADCVLMPNQKKCILPVSRIDIADFTSPLKMFEYMASNRPIISSDLPVLREILEADKNALMAAPDDVHQWEAALNKLMREPTLGKQLAQNAFEKVKNYTWENRATSILEGL